VTEPRPKVSIVCPAYEEEEVLPRFHAALCAVLAPLERDYSFEILYVDDGSRDRTLEVLHELARKDVRVRFLSFSRNFGHQAALTAGLEHATGAAVISMDSDLQHPPELIGVLLHRWREGHDVVVTLRQDDPRLGLFKRLTSRAFYGVMRWLSDTEVRVAASDFRLLSRKALDALLQLRETHRFLRGMVSWLGFPTATVPFAPASRAAGVSKYTFRKMLNFAVDGMLSFSRLPLRLALFLGAGSLGLAVLTALWTAGAALFSGTALDWGWRLVLLAVLAVGGCTLCCLGIVGEYLGRVYEQVKARPLYLLKDASPQVLPLACPADVSRTAPPHALPSSSRAGEADSSLGRGAAA
jgi:glycosyltransferase involved in cell wall biosynthesis